MIEKLEHIIEMQNALNEKTVPNWKEKDLDWGSAILVEAGEALDSCAYKWWKNQEVDIENLKTELVDLFHFMISRMIETTHKKSPVNLTENASNYIEVAFTLHEDLDMAASKSGIIDSLKLFTRDVLNNDYDIYAMARLIGMFSKMEMSFDDIYLSYMTKNMLNWFRQERGYNSPEIEYTKLFIQEDGSTIEDNVLFKQSVQNITMELSGSSVDEIKRMAFKEMDAQVALFKELNAERTSGSI